MGKLIDTDVFKDSLMIGLAPGKEFGELVMMLVCGLIDDEPEAYHNCEDCRNKYRGLCGVCARSYHDQYEREENR